MACVRLLISASLFAAIVYAQDVVLPDGKAKSIVENACAECHGLDQVVSSGMSADDWRKTVNRMVKKGASVTPDQIDSVVEYLSVYFVPDKTNVNAANSQQLRDTLQLTEAEAKAIVDYRTANGNFKDLASLEKVPGVDAKKIEAKKSAISF